MFFYSRVLPAAGVIPTPGQDMPGAPWLKYMRFWEIAVFTFDAKSGQLLRPLGAVPRLPVEEVCMIFGSRCTARMHAKASVLSPERLLALYDSRGRWLSTRSPEGEKVRNPGLKLAWLLFQFPLMTLYGALAVLALSAVGARLLGTDPIQLGEISSPDVGRLLTAGLMVGGFGRLLFEVLRLRLVIWHGKAALAPMGSKEREKLYQRIAKTKSTGLLVPAEISFNPATIIWPVPEKYAEWAKSLSAYGFQHVGQFISPETTSGHDVWFHPENDLRGMVVNVPSKGMWLMVSTRYEDDFSFSGCNKDASGLDPNPKKQIVHLGPEASADAVIECALTQRPEGKRCRPTPENLLDDYKRAWREGIAWRRSRGATAEEIKRVDERRDKPKAVGAFR